MSKIRNEDLGELTAEVLPERSVLGLPLVGQLPVVGGVTKGLPLLGGGGAGGGAAGGSGGMASGL